MTATVLDTGDLRQKVCSVDYPRGTPDQVTMWRDVLAESRANPPILQSRDYISMRERSGIRDDAGEGLSPTAMLEVIHGLYRKPDGAR